MNDSITISRELLQCALNSVEYLALRADDIGASNMPVAEELRALLAEPPLIATLHANGDLIALQATVAQQAKMIEHLKGAQHQGEPVAWSYCPECGSEELHHEEGEHKQCANCHQEWFSDLDYSKVVRGHLAKLKAEQPAPVSVVCDPCAWTDRQVLDFLGVALRNVDLVGEVRLSEIRQGFEYMHNQAACLDEVKRLNEVKP